jgi:ABC-type transport system involved in multi-copper enzyme maturation permease subunit
MNEILLLTIVSVLVFLVFLAMLILSLIKRSKKLYLTTLFVFLFFIGLVGFTVFNFANKSYKKVAETLRPRNGIEIYEALFGKRQSDCVRIIIFQDQIVPKIDYAIWLQIETCPKEIKRILSLNNYSTQIISKGNLEWGLLQENYLAWFNPKSLGDTIIVYEYTSLDGKNTQTLWSNLDSTIVFVKDAFD